MANSHNYTYAKTGEKKQGKKPRSHCNLMETWEKMFYVSQKGKGSIKNRYAQNSRVIVPFCKVLGCLSPACPVLLWHPIAQRISIPVKTRIIQSGSSFLCGQSLLQVIWRVNEMWHGMQTLGNKQKLTGNSQTQGRLFHKSISRLWQALPQGGGEVRV